MEKTQMLKWLEKRQMSPKRGRQHFKAKLNTFNREIEQRENERFASTDGILVELKEAVGETMVKLLVLEEIINDKN